MFLSCGLEDFFAKVVHSQATVGWSSHWNFVSWAFAWQWLSEQTCLSAGSHGILSTPDRSSQADPSKAHISYLKLTILLLFWCVAHIRQLQKTTSSLRHSKCEGWLSRQLPSSSLWMVELFSGTSSPEIFDNACKLDQFQHPSTPWDPNKPPLLSNICKGLEQKQCS